MCTPNILQAVNWNDELNHILRVARMLPRFTFSLFSETTRHLLDTYPWKEKPVALHQYLVSRTLKFCVCNSFPRSSDEVTHALAFLGPRRSAASASDGLWVLSRVQSDSGKPSHNRRNCVSERAYVLSFCADGSVCKPAVLYRFQPETNLSLLRMSTGAFEMFEMSVKNGNKLRLTWSYNEGMKCRCDFNTESLSGVARRQCCGLLVSSTYSEPFVRGRVVREKFGKVYEDVAIEAEIFPQVGDNDFMRAIDEGFKFLDDLDVNTKKSILRSFALFANNFMLGRIRPKGEDAAIAEWEDVNKAFSIVAKTFSS